ncbi:MAG: c-type cytochrome biogenesis protein CcsB [Pseudomonadota bacterium]|uniref:c-type cytochrome biogenesis protein CcsB n=1 Tax=Thermithiobacillus tepidarius TaxID=929 RepID=UPI0004217BAC|nr:c-type cytochrome biogenesis protein CcsB [Thermithiobacillus tepidarius]
MATSQTQIFHQPGADFGQPKSFWRSLTWRDWTWFAILTVGIGGVFIKYGPGFDIFEHVILLITYVGMAGLGLRWRPMQALSLVVVAVTLFAIWLYAQGATPEQNFFLKFLISSQSAIMWMSALFVLATLTYMGFLASQSAFVGKNATALTWAAVAMGFIGLGVRWRETYLAHPDWGHIPVSNLYEVFILFCLITALLYLYYERRYATRSLGAFVMLIVSAAVGFLLWYTFDRQAQEIQPLVPALQSYWMKIHVPANFIGYGAFALSAMVGVAYLLRDRAERHGGFFARVLPEKEMLDDVMYKSIAVGFAFFTIATILGAMWAAEAWGGYWSWDPKETWALIVWLNYAGWLHARISKGWRGVPLAWWSLIGLLVVTFAFLGVNMFLSGLHSYGEL